MLLQVYSFLSSKKVQNTYQSPEDLQNLDELLWRNIKQPLKKGLG